MKGKTILTSVCLMLALFLPVYTAEAEDGAGIGQILSAWSVNWDDGTKEVWNITKLANLFILTDGQGQSYTGALEDSVLTASSADGEITVTITFIDSTRTTVQMNEITGTMVCLRTEGGIRVTPMMRRVIAGRTVQFRASGGTGPYTWWTTNEAVGTVDQNGLFTAVGGGTCAVIAATESDTGSSGQIIVLGGKTFIPFRRRGRVFAANDTLTSAIFPAHASSRALSILVNKKNTMELPEQVRHAARIAAVYEFTAFDPESGEQIEASFSDSVTVTLHYRREDIPEGISEDSLRMARWDSVMAKWESLGGKLDKALQTVTAKTDHFSLYAVTGPTEALPVPQTSWGWIKRQFR